MNQIYKFTTDRTIFKPPPRKTLQEALDEASILPYIAEQKRMAATAEASGKVWGCCPGQGYDHMGSIFKR